MEIFFVITCKAYPLLEVQISQSKCLIGRQSLDLGHNSGTCYITLRSREVLTQGVRIAPTHSLEGHYVGVIIDVPAQIQ